ncbi:RidA family protein [Tateyamaria sp. SN3-11]|uniref:RidA family protein n=1 Tax=Tateyamaria sp. SN3-11 TaxID=3092147 RepID=UPI0039ED3538
MLGWNRTQPSENTPMPKRALIPPALKDACARAGMSPGILSDGHVFLTGVTGSAADGAMPVGDEAQFQACFDKIAAVLAEAGMGLDSIVEMTSYHVGLRGHFDVFDAVRLARLSDPYPAWTAVEVAGLRRVGAVVEIRVIATQD